MIGEQEKVLQDTRDVFYKTTSYYMLDNQQVSLSFVCYIYSSFQTYIFVFGIVVFNYGDCKKSDDGDVDGADEIASPADISAAASPADGR